MASKRATGAEELEATGAHPIDMEQEEQARTEPSRRYQWVIGAVMTLVVGALVFVFTGAFSGRHGADAQKDKGSHSAPSDRLSAEAQTDKDSHGCVRDPRRSQKLHLDIDAMALSPNGEYLVGDLPDEGFGLCHNGVFTKVTSIEGHTDAYFTADDVNDSGEVAGTAQFGESSVAWRYVDGMFQILKGPRDSPDIEDAVAIAADGTVAGTVYHVYVYDYGDEDTSFAWCWDADGDRTERIDLDVLAQADYRESKGGFIDDRGRVYGYDDKGLFVMYDHKAHTLADFNTPADPTDEEEEETSPRNSFLGVSHDGSVILGGTWNSDTVLWTRG